ncbi:programmed cell death protein 2-like isoform X2 [Conger conger]|uniref:programmed cell death protein 2-like isoform X2 n=1 Tax=Conger conger TaxID=82655 RepID=UPI002A59DC1B|nr:programmed cell death protein 2-like isoform X2 [Conger conger]
MRALGKTWHLSLPTNSEACRWTVLRSQCLDIPVCEDKRTKCAMVEEAPMTTRDWCEEADDWGEAEEGPGSSAPACSDEGPDPSSMPDQDFSTRMQELRLEEGGECSFSGGVLDLPGQVPIFCSRYISVMEEGDLWGQTDLEHEQRLLQEYERREGVAVGEMDSCESGKEVEKYEKAKARHGDQVFSRFMKKISLCPEQVLRYCWNGSPILITDPPSNVVPPCVHCGDPRTFEFQLMPALVSLLRSADSSLEMAVEFGTVLVYTCRRSCWETLDTPLQECVFVQRDPDQKFFK